MHNPLITLVSNGVVLLSLRGSRGCKECICGATRMLYVPTLGCLIYGKTADRGLTGSTLCRALSHPTTQTLPLFFGLAGKKQEEYRGALSRFDPFWPLFTFFIMGFHKGAFNLEVIGGQGRIRSDAMTSFCARGKGGWVGGRGALPIILGPRSVLGGGYLWSNR